MEIKFRKPMASLSYQEDNYAYYPECDSWNIVDGGVRDCNNNYQVKYLIGILERSLRVSRRHLEEANNMDQFLSARHDYLMLCEHIRRAEHALNELTSEPN